MEEIGEYNRVNSVKSFKGVNVDIDMKHAYDALIKGSKASKKILSDYIKYFLLDFGLVESLFD
jgi:hypothetical protein